MVTSAAAPLFQARVRFGGFAVSRFHRPAFWQEKHPNLGKTAETLLHPHWIG